MTKVMFPFVSSKTGSRTLCPWILSPLGVLVAATARECVTTANDTTKAPANSTDVAHVKTSLDLKKPFMIVSPDLEYRTTNSREMSMPQQVIQREYLLSHCN